MEREDQEKRAGFVKEERAKDATQEVEASRQEGSFRREASRDSDTEEYSKEDEEVAQITASISFNQSQKHTFYIRKRIFGSTDSTNSNSSSNLDDRPAKQRAVCQNDRFDVIGGKREHRQHRQQQQHRQHEQQFHKYEELKQQEEQHPVYDVTPVFQIRKISKLIQNMLSFKN